MVGRRLDVRSDAPGRRGHHRLRTAPSVRWARLRSRDRVERPVQCRQVVAHARVSRRPPRHRSPAWTSRSSGVSRRRSWPGPRPSVHMFKAFSPAWLRPPASGTSSSSRRRVSRSSSFELRSATYRRSTSGSTLHSTRSSGASSGKQTSSEASPKRASASIKVGSTTFASIPSATSPKTPPASSPNTSHHSKRDASEHPSGSSASAEPGLREGVDDRVDVVARAVAHHHDADALVRVEAHEVVVSAAAAVVLDE